MEDTMNIAILGNCTTDYIAKALTQVCLNYHISAKVYNCPFNQFNQDVLNRDSEFYVSNPELTILIIEGILLFSEWFEVRTIMDSSDKKLSDVQVVLDSLISLVEEVHKNTGTKILLNNFKIPCYSPLGVLDNRYFPGLRDMISLLNYRLSQWASDKEYVYIFDYCAFVSYFGEVNLDDTRMFYTAKTTISLKFTAELAKQYMRYVLPLKFKTKKCLVLDLDNTLWGGIAGEDGISGIKLDITDAGRSFYDFQKEVLNLYDKGIILAINSKNNFEDAMIIIDNHPHMVLKRDHFSALKINWQDKVKNMMEIAEELNIGIDSIVFFDDNIVERELIKSLLPEITVVDVPADTSKYAYTIRNLIEFEQLKLTDEDISRNALYASNKKRIIDQTKYKNLDDYLKSLQTKVILEFSNEFNMPRIAQLTQKTNQFNMTMKRYTQEDIVKFHHSSNYVVLSCQVTDIYGDNGIVGVCIVKIDGECAYIDTFLLSCRVMGRNVEYAFLNQAVALLRDKGIKIVYAVCKRTEKNKANIDFFTKAGLSVKKVMENETEYCLAESKQLKGTEQIETFVKGTPYG